MTRETSQFNKAMNAGHSAAWDQDWEKAAANYRMAVNEFPENVKAMRSLAMALFESHHLEESMQVYLTAAQYDPEDPLTMERIAQIGERIGQIDLVVDCGAKAAVLFMKSKHIDKAIENWLRVIQVAPRNTEAHLNLAMVYEKTGKKSLAIKEFLALAALFQREEENRKADMMIDKSLEIDPNHLEAINAKDLLQRGELLPEPIWPRGGTGPLRMADIRKMEEPDLSDSGLDPISEAMKISLTRMASDLFELKKEIIHQAPDKSQSMNRILKDSSEENDGTENPEKIKKHLGQAIDAQTHGKNSLAAEELEKALEYGFKDPSLYFDLGLLKKEEDQLESALEYLEQTVQSKEYALAARLLMGGIHLKMEQPKEACNHYLEALKLADSEVVPGEHAESIRQLYDPIIETYWGKEDVEDQGEVSRVIEELLNKADWKNQVINGRSHLPIKNEEAILLPLAEIITQFKSSQVIDVIHNVRKLARDKKYRAAMEEAYFGLQYAPTYLPLHSLISDILIEQGYLQEALVKMSVIADAYTMRGEITQASSLFKHIIHLSPMNIEVRNRLIDFLVSQGQIDEALDEYIDLAELYYNQAELNTARNTYKSALGLCQNADPENNYNIRILKRMADIDTQRLDFRQACRVYEQIRTIIPGDPGIRRSIVDLYLRLGNKTQAEAEIDSYILHLSSQSTRKDAEAFLENLLIIHSEEPILIKHLAEEFRLAGKTEEAIKQLEHLGKVYTDSGNPLSAIQVFETIVTMDPPEVEQYFQMINQLKEQA